MDENKVENAGQPVETPPAPAAAAVPAENKQAEYERKLAELQAENQALRDRELARFGQQQPQVAPYNANQYTGSPAQPPAEVDEDLQSLYQTDPVKATRIMIAREKEKIAEEMEKRTAHVAQRTYYAESMKAQAVAKYPELRNPNSDFFKKVAFFMDTHPTYYQDPEGLMNACARVAYDTGVTPATQKANEQVRAAVSNASAQVAGSGNAPAGDTPELDPRGQEMARRLGIDPTKMADRLGKFVGGKGEYAPREGKTGKASL